MASDPTSTSAAFEDRAGRTQRVTADPVNTAPLHPFEGDAHGHNCVRCPQESVWRCDELAHPEHFILCLTQRPEEDVYEDGTPNPCDCRIWLLFDPERVDELAVQYLRGEVAHV